MYLKSTLHRAMKLTPSFYSQVVVAICHKLSFLRKSPHTFPLVPLRMAPHGYRAIEGLLVSKKKHRRIHDDNPETAP